jgi:hypothetical protein
MMHGSIQLRTISSRNKLQSPPAASNFQSN